MQFDDIFEPYERLIDVSVNGRVFQMPENNSILRGFQYIYPEAISEGEFCWNGECLNCDVYLGNGDKEKMAIACRTDVRDDMRIVRLGETIAAILHDEA